MKKGSMKFSYIPYINIQVLFNPGFWNTIHSFDFITLWCLGDYMISKNPKLRITTLM